MLKPVQLLNEAANTLLVGRESSVDAIFNLLAPEARPLLDARFRAPLSALAPRLREGELIELRETDARSGVAVLRTRDSRVVLLSGMVKAEGSELIGLGVKELPADARPWHEDGRPVGLAIGRIIDGRAEIAVSGWRRLDPLEHVEEGTRFRAGSIAKLVTALSVLYLHQSGLISLDEPVFRYLPGWLTPSRRSNPPTGADVLGNRAGFPRDLQDVDLPGASHEGLLAHACAGARPSTFAYSNVGYELLGYLVGQCTGEVACNWITRNVLRPIGLLDSAFDEDGDLAEGYGLCCGFLYGASIDAVAPTAAGLVTTLPDLLALGDWLACPLEARHRTRSFPPEVAVQLLQGDFGLLERHGHNGEEVRLFGGTLSGYRAGVAVVPGLGSTAVLANTGSFAAPELAHHLARNLAMPLDEAHW